MVSQRLACWWGRGVAENREKRLFIKNTGACEAVRRCIRTDACQMCIRDRSEARMERGNVRADINVSLRPTPSSALGTRTETKNVNSFRGIANAVRFEIQRQAQILADGGSVLQETRHFHEEDGTTSSGREKSDAEDYRYFPEPDLVPVVPSEEWVESLRQSLPELPVAKRRRLREQWGFADKEMRDVINAGALELIEATVEAGTDPAAARKWLSLIHICTLTLQLLPP